MIVVSNLTHLTRFLTWVKGVPDGVHVGREILSKSREYSFLEFVIEKPVLHLFARFVIEDRAEPLEGYIRAITLDPPNNKFSITLSHEGLARPTILDFPLDKLKSFEQLSSDSFTEKIKSNMKMASQVLAAKSNPPIRRPECNSTLTETDHRS